MVMFECPQCGYKMQTAQYLNGQGHCLKCDVVVAKTDKHPLNPEWTRKMRERFDRLNTDGKVNKAGLGSLDIEELSALLRKGNAALTDDECTTIFDGADTDKSGKIEFTEFLWFLYGGAGGQAKPAGARAPAAAGHAAPREATAAEHRNPGESSTFKLAPSDACESDSGVCAKNDGGPHHYKFGQCQFCKKGEGQLVKGAGTFAYGGGAEGCAKGGKCMFKFSKCSKCGKRE